MGQVNSQKPSLFMARPRLDVFWELGYLQLRRRYLARSIHGQPPVTADPFQCKDPILEE